jgi:hypothetical protein
MAEMRAMGFDAPFPQVQPFDDAAFAPPAAAGAEARPNTVARHREGQEYRFSVVFGDTVAENADPLDDKLNQSLGVSLVPITRSRHHLAPSTLCGVLASNQVSVWPAH